MVDRRQNAPEDSQLIRQIEESFDGAKAELATLRKKVEQTARFGDLQAALSRARGNREGALLKLGEAFYRMVESGEFAPPEGLRRALSEVQRRDIELSKQQADIAALLKEADALAEKTESLSGSKKGFRNK